MATAKFEFADGYVTITLETTGQGALAPGFHGVHIHSVGKCEANSVAPPAVRRATSFPPEGISRRRGIRASPRAAT